jgi:hypothetical protein
MIPTESGKASWYQSPEISERLKKGTEWIQLQGAKRTQKIINLAIM